MSATVKLSSKLPGVDEPNGLDAIAGQLVDDPEQIRTAVIFFDVSKLTVDTDTNATIPTVRLRQVEVITEDRDAVAKYAQAAFHRRTGRSMLEFDELGED